MDGSGW